MSLGEEEGTEEARRRLEAVHVHAVYSQIARHFSATRYKPWPRVAQFLAQLPPGSLIADVGCGNGKYLSVPCNGGHVIGCDMCPELVSIAASRGHDVAVSDCLSLPFRSSTFDALICIAVVHHLSSQLRRIQALREVVRVVREGGRILVYVWAMEQERKKFLEQDVMVPWHLQSQYATQTTACTTTHSDSHASASRHTPVGTHSDSHASASRHIPVSTHSVGQTSASQTSHSAEEKRKKNQEQQKREKRREMDIGERNDSASKPEEPPGHVTSEEDHMIWSQETPRFTIFQRYYHVFREHELKSLFNEVGGARVLEEFYDHENWCVVAEKIT